MIVSTKEIFNQCYGRYAVAAVNVWCLEQIHGLFSAAQIANSPFIAQISPYLLEYTSSSMMTSILIEASKLYPEVIFAIHLDQGNPGVVLQCIESDQYNSVQIEVSNEKILENIQITKELVKNAHASNITVEADLGVFNYAQHEENITQNQTGNDYISKVEKFVRETGCDSLSVAIGTRKGAFKYAKNGGIKFAILKEIQKRLPDFPLVMHGGSSINKDDVLRINAAGGRLGVDANGVTDKEITKAIQHGICKINIDTDSLLIWARVYREFFKYNPAQFDPIIPGRKFKEEFEKFCLNKFELFNSAGQSISL